jgi:hypothetical protein
MTDTKKLTRVKLPLTAKSRKEIVDKQLANNIARDKEFDYSNPVWLAHEKIYLCWYFDTLRPGEQRQID